MLLYAVSYADSRPGRRRRGGPRLTDRTLNVALGAELYRRIDAAAQRYGCAAGMVARYAIEHGMRGALPCAANCRRTSGQAPPRRRPRPPSVADFPLVLIVVAWLIALAVVLDRGRWAQTDPPRRAPVCAHPAPRAEAATMTAHPRAA